MSPTRDGMLCQLDSRGYVLDVNELAFQGMDPTRQGVDQGAGAGSSSLSNAVVWRRVRDNWVLGAGQEYADLEGNEDPSSELRFHTVNPGIDCFQRRKLTLHPAPTGRIHLPKLGIQGDMAIIDNCEAVTRLNRDTYGITSVFIDAVANWRTMTNGIGLVLMSNSTATETGFRFRIFFSGAIIRLYLDLNTTGTGTAYNKTFQSDDLATIIPAGSKRFMFGVTFGISSGSLKCRFTALGDTDTAITDGFHGAYSDLSTGVGWDAYGIPGDGAITTLGNRGGAVTVGNAYNTGGAGNAATDTFGSGLVYGLSIGTRPLFSETSPYIPAGMNSRGAAFNFVDGNAWAALGDAFTYGDQLVLTALDGSTGVTVDMNTMAVQSQSTSAQGQWLLPVGGTSAIPDGWGWVMWVTEKILVEVFIHMAAPDYDEYGRLAYADNRGIRWIIPPFVTSGSFTTEPYFFGVTSWKAGCLLVTQTNGSPDALYQFDGSSIAELVDPGFDIAAAVGSRVLVATDNVLSELNADTTTTAIYTHYNTLFRWHGAVAAPNAIYAWGSDGGRTEIFQLPINDATGAVGAPIPAGSTEIAEVVNFFLYHEGIFILGTMRGIRLATINGDGSLAIGGLLERGRVDALEASGRFAYADTATGLVKMDLSRFAEPEALIPPWAFIPADVHAPPGGNLYDATGGTVGAIGLAPVSEYHDPQPLFLFGSTGKILCDWVEFEGGPVTAEIDLGWFTFGIGEPLAFDSILLECDPTPAGSTHAVEVHIDTPETNDVVTGTSNLAEPIFTTRYTGDLRARRFRVRLVLTGDATVGDAPVVRQVVLKAVPAPEMADEMLLPIMLQDSVETEHGQISGQDVWEEWSHLIGLRDSRQPVTLKIGSYTKTVRIEGLEVRGGGMGGGNGLLGYDRDDGFLAGRWNVRVVTVA